LVFNKVIVIFFAAILLIPLGGSPPILPTQIDNPEIKLVLEYAESIGLTKYLPNLGPILQAQAMENNNGGNDPGKFKRNGFTFDETTSPLQRGIEASRNIMECGEEEDTKGKGKGKAKPCKVEDKCKDFPNRPAKNENKGQRKCSDIPGLTMEMESMEDINNENGEKVGFIIKTKTVLTFDQPGQGHKKNLPDGDKEIRKSWDKIQLNKPENPGRDKSNNSKAKGQAQNQNNAAFFPALAVNDDNDCTRDSDGEHFGGPNVADGTAESCFEGGGLLRDGFTELKDEDPVDKINDDNDCERDSDGAHFGGIDVDDGVSNSCFDDDGLLKDGLTLLIDEDPTVDGIDQDGDGQDGEDPLNQIDNDGDGLFDEDGPNGTFEDACVDPEVGGILSDGQCDLTDMVISKTNEKTKKMTFNPDNDCVDKNGNRLGELKDNFGSLDSCFDGDGNLKQIDGQTVQPLDGEDPLGDGTVPPDGFDNDDFDCVEVDESGNAKDFGKILVGDPTDGIPDKCYDGNAEFDKDGILVKFESIKTGFKELVDEDTVVGGMKFYKDNKDDSDGMENYGEEKRKLTLKEEFKVKFSNFIAVLTIIKDPTNDSGGTALPDDFELTVNGEAVTSGEPNNFDANTDLVLGETLVDGYEFVEITGDPECPEALGDTFKLRLGADVTCTIVNDDVAQGNQQNSIPISYNDKNDILSMIISNFSGLYNVLSGNIPEASAQFQADQTDDILFGFTIAPPDMDWGIDYSEEVCFPELKIFGVTIIPEFCLIIFAVFIGYHISFAVGLRLPVTVTTSSIPTRLLAEDKFRLQTKIVPKDLNADQYRKVCKDNNIVTKAGGLIGGCDKFAFVNVLDNSDGDEFGLKYQIKAGVFVTVLNIDVIAWGIDSNLDLGSLCTSQLARINELVPESGENPNEFFKDNDINCSSFVTPFGFDEVFDGVGKIRPWPGTNKEIKIIANCLDARIAKETIKIRGKVVPICTGIALQKYGASLGLGLGIETALGSENIEATLTVSGDVVSGDTRDDVDYDADFSLKETGQIEFIRGEFTKDITVDNTSDKEFVEVSIDGFTYRLNAAQILGIAILDFGGILSFIDDIPAFVLFDINVFELLGVGAGAPIPQHPWIEGTKKFKIIVDNYALELTVTPDPSPPAKLKVEPGVESEPHAITIKNIGTLVDSFTNFIIDLPFSGIVTTIDDPVTHETEVVPRDGFSAPYSFTLEPERVFTTRPGDYTVVVKADSKNSVIEGLAAQDPLLNFRQGAPDTFIVEVLAFPNPLVSVPPGGAPGDLPFTTETGPGGQVDYAIQILNQGNAPDNISLSNEFVDFNESNCTLTTLGSIPGCPYRAVPTAIQLGWTNIGDIPTETGESFCDTFEVDGNDVEVCGLQQGTSVTLSPELSVLIPSDWAGMTATTYQYDATVTSTLDSSTNPPPGTMTNDIAQIQVNPTKESMMRYIGLELAELKQKLTDTSLNVGAIKGLMAILEKPVTTSFDKAFDNVLADNFNNANKNLSTMQKQMEAFVHALNGIDGKNNKLEADGDDWLASAEAILGDIQTAKDFN